MPVSHSHQLLWASLRLSTGVETSTGLLGSVTSKTSCPCVPFSRSRYVLPGTPLGRVLPSHARTIWAPPASPAPAGPGMWKRSEEHTSELQSQSNLVCRLLLEKKKKKHPQLSDAGEMDKQLRLRASSTAGAIPHSRSLL